MGGRVAALRAQVGCHTLRLPRSPCFPPRCCRSGRNGLRGDRRDGTRKSQVNRPRWLVGFPVVSLRGLIPVMTAAEAALSPQHVSPREPGRRCSNPRWARAPQHAASLEAQPPLLSGSLVPNPSAVLVSLRFLVILFYHGHGASFMFIRTFLEEHKRFTSILIPIWTLNPKCSSYLGEPVLLRGLLSP